jgi:hypothetical protein
LVTLHSRTDSSSEEQLRATASTQEPQTSLILDLGRNSDLPNEYWVFSPVTGITSNNEIGRITTALFDHY